MALGGWNFCGYAAVAGSKTISLKKIKNENFGGRARIFKKPAQQDGTHVRQLLYAVNRIDYNAGHTSFVRSSPRWVPVHTYMYSSAFGTQIKKENTKFILLDINQ